jgi:hypothetical protein
MIQKKSKISFNIALPSILRSSKLYLPLRSEPQITFLKTFFVYPFVLLVVQIQFHLTDHFNNIWRRVQCSHTAISEGESKK